MTWHIYIIVALITLLGAFQVQRFVAYKNACRSFRNAVMSELTGLYPTPAKWPEDKIAIINILSEKFPAIESAVDEYRRHLPWWRKRRFDSAWLAYIGGCKGTGADHGYWQYMPYHGDNVTNGKFESHDNRLTYKENFKTNVETLLSYAKET